MEDYTKTKEVYKRLERTYLKFGKLIVAYDFDNTVRDYKTGLCNEKVAKLIREVKDYSYLIVYTCRTIDEEGFVIDWLKENNIPFDSINEPYGETLRFTSKCKLYFNILLDDKAGLPTTYKCLKKLSKKIKKGKLKK